MENISFKVLNLILSNIDDKPSSIQPVKGYEAIYTVNFDNGEVAQVEVFPENEGINFHWIKVNDNQELLDKAYNDPKGEGMESYSFNINDFIYVKLKDKGFEHLSKESGVSIDILKERSKDNSGYTKLQAWDFMQVFSPTISFNDLIFFPTIVFAKNSLGEFNFKEVPNEQ